MRKIFLILFLIFGLLSLGANLKRVNAQTNPLANIHHVFVILMENKDWSSITPAAAPYINNTLLKIGAHASNYHNIPTNLGSLHPSEPNYITLEAGTNALPDFTFTTDNNSSSSNSTSSTAHLATLLSNKGFSWKSYQENVPSGCPVNSSGQYAAKHNPFVFFQNISGNPPSNSNTGCAAHMSNLTTTILQNDLNSGNVANYNFLTPNLCNDMHDCSVTTGDTWLSTFVPIILNSNLYKNDGAIFITWDEGGSGNNPIGMIMLSPFAKPGFTNNTEYSHPSTVKTVEDIFGLSPYIGHAADANVSNLSAFFGTATQTAGPTPTPVPTATVTPIPTGLPDLVVTNVTWSPANPVVGDNVTFSATIKNQGAAADPNGIIQGISFLVDGTQVTWSDNVTVSLAAGASRTQTANGGKLGTATWTATAGTHQITAFVDDVNRITESNETNNQLNASLTVSAASSPTATPTPTTTPIPTACTTTIPSGTGISSFSMNMPKTGNYTFWARMMNQGDASNSFYGQIDNNCPFVVGDVNGTASNTWIWQSVTNINITAGNHIVKLAGREPNVKVDEVLFLDTGCTPTGLGANCSLQGDANGDGKVDNLDFNIWLSHLGQTISGTNNGDFNGDNKVNGIDYSIWLANFGK